MKKTLRSNTGLASRFQLERAFVFDNYEADELLKLLERECKLSNLQLPAEARVEACKAIEQMRCLPDFGNGRAVKGLVSQAVVRMNGRIPSGAPRVLASSDFAPGVDPSALDTAWKELSNIEHIERHFDDMRLLAGNSRRHGRDTKKLVNNYLFVGRPGTGKTTVARKVAELFYQLELLPSNRYEEVSAQQLQGKYMGSTAQLVEDKMKAAMGGVLFIDEAYGLHPKNGQYAQEAFDRLLQCLTSPEYEGKLVVVMAGYKRQVGRMNHSV